MASSSVWRSISSRARRPSSVSSSPVIHPRPRSESRAVSHSSSDHERDDCNTPGGSSPVASCSTSASHAPSPAETNSRDVTVAAVLAQQGDGMPQRHVGRFRPVERAVSGEEGSTRWVAGRRPRRAPSTPLHRCRAMPRRRRASRVARRRPRAGGRPATRPRRPRPSTREPRPSRDRDGS